MLREIVAVCQGIGIWQELRFRVFVDEKTVVLVLTENNRKLDWYALVHLKDFMDRKYAKKAIILFHSKMAYQQIMSAGLPGSVRLCYWDEKKIWKIYIYYSFYRFSDKLVFTYTNIPKDNPLGKLLRETRIQEEEVVCLGLYRLRTVPCLEKM